jgi:uncharacterized protein
VGSPVQILLLVVQPTAFCNIDCSYCYLPQRHVKRWMDRATLERTAEVVLQSPYVGDQLTVAWHAGEPLVLPTAFYEDAFAIFEAVRPPGLTLTHSFQTNAILLNHHWADFIARAGARVGVSIDGPAFCHDAHRRTRRGRGTHAATLAGIRCLQARGLEFHVISVLTADALEAPDAFVDFYLEHGIRDVGFNVEEIEGPHTISSLQRAGTEEAYARFMGRIISRVRGLPPGTLLVRELRAAVEWILGSSEAVRRDEQTEPLGIVNIDVDGNMSTFSPELLGAKSAPHNDFAFGNLRRDDLDDMLAHPALRRTYAEIREGVRRCASTCPYFDFCGGGAPANKLFENGSFASTETMFCRLTKQTLIKLVLTDLEQTLGRPC